MGLVKGIILNILAIIGLLVVITTVLVLSVDETVLKEFGTVLRVAILFISMGVVIWLGESYCDDREMEK